jgi:hypothetical protein
LAAVVDVVVVLAEVVVDVFLQEVSTEAEIRDATSIKLKPKNRIFLFTSFSPYIFSWCFSFCCPWTSNFTGCFVFRSILMPP